MNICIFLDSSLDAPGGTTQSVLNQRTVLEQAGHTVYIVCIGRRVIDDPRIYYARPYISVINDDVNFGYLLANPLTSHKIARFLQPRAIDLVHVQSESTMAALGVRLARRFGVPVIATVHNYFWPATGPFQLTGGLFIQASVLLFTGKKLLLSNYGNNRLERAIRGLTERICGDVDTVVAPSAHLGEKLQMAGVATPIAVVPNPYVENGEVAPVLLQAAQVPHFVWVGRCAPEKRLAEFIQAVEIVQHTSSQPFRVTVIGAGPDLAKSRRYAATHGLSGIVTYTGKIPNTDVIAHIDNASVVVLTSYHFDNQPVVVAEAISRYRGVLYCDERLQEGLDRGGLRAKSPEPEAIAAEMLRIIAEPQLAVELSRGAKISASEFSGASYAAHIERIVRRLGSS